MDFTNNIIVIGGTIASGKSTLANDLSEKLNLEMFQELDENNKVQDLFLECTYSKSVHMNPLLIELYFLLKRKDLYVKHSQERKDVIFDRSLIESLWFAKENLNSDNYEWYKKYWKDTIEKVMQECGKPKKYIILSSDWNTFESRIRNRGHNNEIDYFDKNRSFFEKHINEYNEFLINILEDLNINYDLINTSQLTSEIVFDKVKNIISMLEINKRKYSNAIIIGGPIAVGKSTLVKSIAEKLNCDKVEEIDEDDKLTKLVLEGLYKKEVSPAALQAFFLQNRFDRYVKNVSNNKMTIFDRGILEDTLFAKHVMEEEPVHEIFYQEMWRERTKELFTKYGFPKLYVFLKVDYDNFEKRLFNRGREVEISNFSKNKSYFKKLLDTYNEKFENVLKMWGINYITVDTTKLSEKEVLKEVLKEAINIFELDTNEFLLKIN